MRIERHYRTTEIIDDTFQRAFPIETLGSDRGTRDQRFILFKAKILKAVRLFLTEGGMTLSLCKSIHAHTNTHSQTHVLIFANTLMNTKSGTILIWLIIKAAISPLTIGLDARQKINK